MEKNVFGETLKICSMDPTTGYLRDGFCRTINKDTGTHTVCAVMTNETGWRARAVACGVCHLACVPDVCICPRCVPGDVVWPCGLCVSHAAMRWT